MTRFLCTDSVPPHLRKTYWTEMISSTCVPLDCEVAHAAPLDGTIMMHTMPGLEILIISAGAQTMRRTQHHIARATDAYFLVSVQTRGQGIVHQNGREAVLGPGDFALYDSMRSFELHFENSFQQLVLKLPSDQLRQTVRCPEQRTAMKVCGQTGAGLLMVNFLQSLWQGIDDLNAASSAAVAGGVLNILAAGLQSLPADDPHSLSALAAYHLTRIKGLIETRLRDPALCIADVACELGLSIGHIHRLFKNEATTPTQYIWNRRLEACSQDLLDPVRRRHSICEIAFSWGFNDAAHFSRAFRNRFNSSPREWRLRS